MIKVKHENVDLRPDANASDDLKELKKLVDHQKAARTVKVKSDLIAGPIHHEAVRKSQALLAEANTIVAAIPTTIKEAIAENKQKARVKISLDLFQIIEIPFYKQNPLMPRLFMPSLDLPDGSTEPNPLSDVQKDYSAIGIRTYIGRESAKTMADGTSIEEHTYIGFVW